MKRKRNEALLAAVDGTTVLEKAEREQNEALDAVGDRIGIERSSNLQLRLHLHWFDVIFPEFDRISPSPNFHATCIGFTKLFGWILSEFRHHHTSMPHALISHKLF